MRNSKAKALSPRHRRFVEEYLLDLNASQAAVRAGYKEKSARFTAAELLARPDVQEAISVAQAARSEATGIKAARVLEELARIAFADIRDVVAWGTVPGANGAEERFVVNFKESQELTADAAAAIASVEHGSQGFKLRFHNKTRALELIARHLGILDKDTMGKGGGEKPVPLTKENVADLSKRARLAVVGS